jgi:hypothetical protein
MFFCLCAAERRMWLGGEAAGGGRYGGDLSPRMGGSGKQKSAKPIFGWSVGGLPPLKTAFGFKDFDFKDFDFII